MWSQLNFGKYKGKTLPQIVLTDPDYFFWAMENNVFDGEGDLLQDAEEVYHKARNIKINPAADGEPQEAEYCIHPITKKFADLEVVPISRPLHSGSSQAFRRKVIDLSIPRRIALYDKTGCRLLMRQVKDYVFGNNARLTKKRCEEFFDNGSNFL